MDISQSKTAMVVITEITILERKGFADNVSLTTVFPNPFEINKKENLSLNFKTPQGEGVSYIKELFGIEPKIIKVD